MGAVHAMWEDTGRHALPRRSYQVAGGELRVCYPAPGALVTSMHGHLGMELLTPLRTSFDVAARLSERVTVFHDWSAATGYDPNIRAPYMLWSGIHRSEVNSVHVLAPSPLFVAALAVANLALGFLRSYQDATRFEAEFNRWMRSNGNGPET